MNYKLRGLCRLLLLALSGSLLVPRLMAQAEGTKGPQNVDTVLSALSTVRNFYGTAISPDGRQVLWVVENRSGEGGRGPAIYLADVNTPDRARRITAPGNVSANETQPVWSPDGKRIAFLSDAGSPGQQQLYVAEIASGKTRRLTDVSGFISSPGWSPDGENIALLFLENSPRAAGPLQPMIPPSGVIEEHVYEQRLCVVSSVTGRVRTISPADMYVYEYDWLPSGSGFIITAVRGNGDNNWWIAALYVISLEGDGRVRLLYKPELQIANPRVSPDGRMIAFIHGLMSDQGVVGGDVWLGSFKEPPAEVSGFFPRNLTPGMPASATWLTWSGPDRLSFTEIVDGNTGVASVDTSGNLQTLWTGPELISAGNGDVSLSLAADGKQSAIVRSSTLRPPEVWVGAVGAWKQFTRANRETKTQWGEARIIQWKSDQFSVQGWLLLPRDYDARRKYPLIVHVHGGPASACSPGWPNSDLGLLTALGYFVFCPNPRGSYGQGEGFTRANVRDFGGGDFRDIMAGVDEVLREFPIDPQRLGIEGWSYGGYMTMWAETQTTRFRAAVAGAGLANWLSYYGENDIDQWMLPYFGATVYDDPNVYARSSPINFVKKVKTPTLILVGDRDGECPAPQSFEWWHALKTLAVPVQFVVYSGEGHAIRQSEHRRDVIVRTVAWYDQWLGKSSGQ